MRPGQRLWWGMLAVGGAALVGALVWISVVVVDLELRERRALADVQRREVLGVALWRLDSWLAPLLAREAARPYFEYTPYYEASSVYTSLLGRIAEGEVLKRSPLVTSRDPFVRLYFQVDAAGVITSPQAPRGNLRDLAEASCLMPMEVDENGQLLRDIELALDLEALRPRLVEEMPDLSEGVQTAVADGRAQEDVPGELQAQEAWIQDIPQEADAPAWMRPPAQTLQTRRGSDDRPVQSRAWSSQQELLDQQIGNRQYLARKATNPDNLLNSNDRQNEVEVAIGGLVPVWVDLPPEAAERWSGQSGSGQSAGPELAFVRRVIVGGEPLVQGFVTHWERLEADMLTEIAELLPDARIVPAREGAEIDAATMLATVPAALVADPPEAPPAGFVTPARMVLGVAWLAVLTGLALGGFSLRAALALADRRSRFASAVTHELRTPLTTFQMYSEMLADGMVADEAQRAVYLDTLCRESRRLASLVENVLAYSRVEQGGGSSRYETTRVDELLRRIESALRRRCDEADRALEFTASPGEQLVETDVDVVAQILFNLVDNACKYSAGRTIELRAEAGARCVRLAVCDEGPGIAPKDARRVFEPFDRGGRDQADPQPGVGLGLALSRELAHELGGTLELEPRGEGACFVLTLPTR